MQVSLWRGQVIHNQRLLRKQLISCYFHNSSITRNEKSGNKSFSDTLLLPKTSFPLRLDPRLAEESYKTLTCDGLYQWQLENASRPLFVLHDGPPYANGDLHMGHALNKVVKDIINRFHVSQGRRVHYVPGWDCHGLPIENKAMKDMGQNPLDTPPAEIRAAARATAMREISSQREQFRILGIMADWDSNKRTYRTLDKHYVIRQLKIFRKMVEKALAEAELVYKDDHVSHSVYVTFDVDQDSHPVNQSLKAVLPTGNDVRFLVWTTTPWTLTANMGLAVHKELRYSVILLPDMPNLGALIVAQELLGDLSKFLGPFKEVTTFSGSELVGLAYHPIFGGSSTGTLKVVPSPHVTNESGTGVVHCAPSHGAEDYNVFKSLGLLPASADLLCHVDALGEFSENVAEVVGQEFATMLIGKSVLGEGNKQIVNILKGLGKVAQVMRYKHRYPYDWKTDEPVVVRATSQWFANLDEIKSDALAALDNVSFFPAQSRNRLESFISSRSEWCISRQRVWGVPIPALHHIETDEAILDASSLSWIIEKMENEGLDWWESPVEAFIPPHLSKTLLDGKSIWKKGTDTMDVWFDSGTSWSMLGEMGVGADAAEGRVFAADLCLEGSDQHRGWFQSQLLTAVASAPLGKKPFSPYGALITHGMVLDEKGKKMSKSLGNIVSPMTIVKGGVDNKGKQQVALGADLLRIWAASVEFWKDMSIGPTAIAQAAESMRKLRNSARFCLGNMGSLKAVDKIKRVEKDEMGLAERYIMRELYVLEQTALGGYSSYNIPKVMTALNHFANITLSSLYFDITKDILYAGAVDSLERRSVVTVLEQVLNVLTRVVAPITPYLAEEIHATWKADGRSVFATQWVPLDLHWDDLEAETDMNELMALRSKVLSLLENARGRKHIKSALEAEVEILLSEPATVRGLSIQRHEEFLKTLFIVSDAKIVDKTVFEKVHKWEQKVTMEAPGKSETNIVVRVRPATLEKCPRCWTYTRSEAETLCKRCHSVVKS